MGIKNRVLGSRFWIAKVLRNVRNSRKVFRSWIPAVRVPNTPLIMKDTSFGYWYPTNRNYVLKCESGLFRPWTCPRWPCSMIGAVLGTSAPLRTAAERLRHTSLRLLELQIHPVTNVRIIILWQIVESKFHEWCKAGMKFIVASA